MSDPSERPWSSSDSAPQITKHHYTAEKATLAGSFIGSILYGVVIILFFQCMVALLNPVYRRGEGVKWWLVSHTVAMFSFVTVYTAINLHIQSNSFIDNRKDIPLTTISFSGPLYYQWIIRGKALGLIPNIVFNLNNWLADGLLIYRCYIIYSTNLWAIALPCLLYLASLGMGIVILYFQANKYGYTDLIPVHPHFGIPYLSISVSLNVLLTLMIVIRLILHGRNVRAATGSTAGITGLCKTVATILIESCALFAGTSLVVVAALIRAADYSDENFYSGSYVVDIFFPILAEIQVIAPLLITQRVADRSALTSQTIITRDASSHNVRRQEEPTGGDGEGSGEFGVLDEKTTDFHRDGSV